MKRLDVLKSRKTAFAALILAVLVFTPIGVRMSFSREGAKVERVFYGGIPGESYTKPPIDAQLNTYAEAMLGYATVAAKYPDLAGGAEAMLAARRELLSAETAMEKYRAFIDLTQAYYGVHEIIISASRQQNDYDAWNDYGSTRHGANMYIKGVVKEYNDRVDRLLNMAEKFPIRYLGGGLARYSLEELRFGDSYDWLEWT
ncbi:MAG: hypothetical protein LBJ84_05525 [Oscillospiraceae bacterium]|nr:hypothetical protein [Oscillospiraceae bacterium]